MWIIRYKFGILRLSALLKLQCTSELLLPLLILTLFFFVCLFFFFASFVVLISPWKYKGSYLWYLSKKKGLIFFLGLSAFLKRLQKKKWTNENRFQIVDTWQEKEEKYKNILLIWKILSFYRCNNRLFPC